MDIIVNKFQIEDGAGVAITDIFSGNEQEKINWAEANGLWTIANFKIIGLNIMEIFIPQAQDTELKKALNFGVEMLIIPHIEKIQKFMHKEGLEVPAVPTRTNLDIISKKFEPNSLIKDLEIARCARETYIRGLELDMHGYLNSAREDVRNLIWGILCDDNKGFEAMMKLIKSKNWLATTATV